MKTSVRFIVGMYLLIVSNQLDAQSSAFTYQGQLVDNGLPANGSYDLTFALFSASNGVGQVGATLTNAAVVVTNGQFTAALDFGNQFPGDDRWLEVAVSTNGAGSFTMLAPRQHLTPSPYAITAMNLSSALSVTQLFGALNNNQLANSGVTINAGSGLSGGGAVALGGVTTLNNSGVLSVSANAPLTSSGGPNPILSLAGSVDAATLAGLSASNFWQLGGNNAGPGQSLGTANNQPLELVVNGLRVSRLEAAANTGIVSNAVNLINGSSVNFASSGVYGATIGGGGAASYFGVAYPNSVTAMFGTASGGLGNTSGGSFSFVGGGFQNAANAYIGTVGGGSANFVNANAGTIGGGSHNTVSFANATVSGGYLNTASGYEATVGGGYYNTASGDGSVVSGGGDAGFSQVVGNVASGTMSLIGGGFGNNATNWFSTVGGGYLNFVGGGAATIPGGSNNLALGGTSFAAGNQAQALHSGSFVWADSQAAAFGSTAPDQFLIRAAGGVGIGKSNPATALDVNGTVTAASFSGSGAGLTGLNPANLTAGTAGISISGNAATAGNFTGNLAGDVTGAQNATVVLSVGGQSAANVASGATAANAATSANTPNTIVQRDASGNFSAGTVTATSFSGNGSGLTNVTAAMSAIPPGMAIIPAGAFTMGDALDGETDAVPVSATISAFYMDVNPVNYSQWQSVYFWATNQGYGFVNAGAGKAANHPVHTVDWYDAVKWCNARSQQAGVTPVYYTDAGFTQVLTNGEVPNVFANWSAKGYRLPTEAEWEKAARGGLGGQRFPWGNVITENLANYDGDTSDYAYDLGANGFNANFASGAYPYTNPSGYFAPNAYGLYDMAGNVLQWCWDWYGTPYAGGNDPQGPASSPNGWRVCRGGDWNQVAYSARCAARNYSATNNAQFNLGFRCVRGL